MNTLSRVGQSTKGTTNYPSSPKFIPKFIASDSECFGVEKKMLEQRPKRNFLELQEHPGSILHN